MIQFSETKAKDSIRTFQLTENGMKIGFGSLNLQADGQICVRLTADGVSEKDFLFRSLLNVCMGFSNFTAVVDADTAKELGGEPYIERFSFKKNADGGYTARIKEIQLDTCKKGERL